MTKKRKLSFGVEPSKVNYRLRSARYPALADAIAHYVEGRKNQKLLDVGVGYGRTYRYVNAWGAADRIDWYGFDIGRAPTDKQAGAGAYKVTLANIKEGLPYDDDFFDIVVAEQILEHLPDPVAAVAELCRVAKPGALLIIGVPVFPGWIAALRNSYIRHFPRGFEWTGSDHIQTFSLKSIRELLLRGGEVEETGVRGFRFFSGGPLRPLENYRWWYRFNGWLGRKIPGLCVEVQLYLRRR